MLRAILATALLVAGCLALLPTGAAEADEGQSDCIAKAPVYDEKVKKIVVKCIAWEQGGDGAQHTGTGSSSEACYTAEGEVLPACRLPGGAWWNGTCFVDRSPIELSSAVQWEGPNGEQVPEEGNWHYCYRAVATDHVGSGIRPCPQGGSGFCVWIPVGVLPAANPVDVAWDAVASLRLSPIEVGIVPKSGEDRFGLVGLPTWMWVADPDDTSWGPVTASASDGPVSVSITARARQVFWDMGDGNVVVCGKGVPYDPVYGIAESPNCGHVYERTSVDEPDQAYLVTATTQWVVEWSGGGMTGTIEFDLVSNPVPIRVGEMQVLLQ